MRKYENLLMTIAEECAEIISEATKSLRFGLNNHHPLKPSETNAQNLVKEFYQLSALIEKAQSDGHLPKYDEKIVGAIKLEKLRKFAYWQDVSLNEGIIVETPKITKDKDNELPPVETTSLLRTIYEPYPFEGIIHWLQQKGKRRANKIPKRTVNIKPPKRNNKIIHIAGLDTDSNSEMTI